MAEHLVEIEAEFEIRSQTTAGYLAALANIATAIIANGIPWVITMEDPVAKKIKIRAVVTNWPI